MQSWTRLPTLTLQFGIGRSIDLSQFARSPIYGFIALTGRSIREADACVITVNTIIQEGEVFALAGDMGARQRRSSLPRIAHMPRGLGRNLYPS